jgi:hypothetical protein
MPTNPSPVQLLSFEKFEPRYDMQRGEFTIHYSIKNSGRTEAREFSVTPAVNPPYSKPGFGDDSYIYMYPRPRIESQPDPKGTLLLPEDIYEGVFKRDRIDIEPINARHFAMFLIVSWRDVYGDKAVIWKCIAYQPEPVKKDSPPVFDPCQFINEPTLDHNAQQQTQ